MVLEGWLPDYSLKEMMKVYHELNCGQLIITGLPVEKGYYTTGLNDYASIAAHTLASFGFDTSGIVRITIPRAVRQDRTYATAVALREYLKNNEPGLTSLNIFTLGCHARRSRLLFREALGKEYDVGIIAGQDKSYDMKQWWKSSRGFRTVTNEGLAYLYVEIFFYPDREQVIKRIHEGRYHDKIDDHRFRKDLEFADRAYSPLKEEQVRKFTGLNYFPPDPDLAIKAGFVIDTAEGIFKMKTSTNRLPEYRKYGRLTLIINSDTVTLYAYQNIELTKKPEYRDYLFIPFRDSTCGTESYGGGRYIDFEIPDSDSATIDFNYAYNPYCTYNDRYSCPVPPVENWLRIHVRAGEKKFEK